MQVLQSNRIVKRLPRSEQGDWAISLYTQRLGRGGELLAGSGCQDRIRVRLLAMRGS